MPSHRGALNKYVISLSKFCSNVIEIAVLGEFYDNDNGVHFFTSGALTIFQESHLLLLPINDLCLLLLLCS